jgi:hypothetical protein
VSGKSPAMISSSVGSTGRMKPPPISLNTTAMKLSLWVPNNAAQPDADLDPFCVEHTLQITVYYMKIMLPKKCTLSLPIKVFRESRF